MQINLIHNYEKIFSPSLTKENVQFLQCACTTSFTTLAIARKRNTV